MSVHALNWVFEHSRERGARKLVLLAVANRANEHGHGAWPSIATLAREAGLSKRATQYALRALEQSGALEKEGVSSFGTAVWRVAMDPPRADPEGVQDMRPEGVHEMHGGGARDAPKPSVEPLLLPSSFASLKKKASAHDEKRPEKASQRREVFEFWRETFGKSGRTKLDAVRSRKIDSAIAAYGVDQVRRCLEGYALSEFHRRRGYDDVALFLRDATHVERGLDLAEGRASGSDDRGPRDERRTAYEERLAGDRAAIKRLTGVDVLGQDKGATWVMGELGAGRKHDG